MRLDLGHREVSTRLPEPLEVSGPLSLAGRALPALGLSIASAAALVVVAVVLLHDPRSRALFEMPFPATRLAWPAALLSVLILWQTSSRPGRHLPRYWALILTAGSVLLALIASLPWAQVGTPALHGLVVADVTAVLTLAPRLIKLHPHSPWVQRVALLSFGAVLVIALPAALAVGDAVAGYSEGQVGAMVRELRERTAKVQQLTREFDWRSYYASPDLAEVQIERLRTLRFDHLARDPQPYRAAEIVGLEQELADAARELTDAVADGFEATRLPRISSLSEPAVRWDTIRQRWVESSSFPSLSAIVGRYHSELGRLLDELAPGEAAMANDALQDLANHHRQRRSEVRDALEDELASFPDHWAVARMGVLEAPPPSLIDVLKMPMLLDSEAGRGDSERRGLTAASLVPLLGLPQSRAREYARGSEGCHPRTYDHKGRGYYRLDCYAYLPHAEKAGASLRVEFRLVYQRDLPAPLEAYYILPIPPGVEEDAFRDEALNSLARAVLEVCSGETYAHDLGGSYATGFRYLGTDSAFDVRPLESTEFSPGRWAIQVRVVPRPRA